MEELTSMQISRVGALKDTQEYEYSTAKKKTKKRHERRSGSLVRGLGTATSRVPILLTPMYTISHSYDSIIPTPR